MKPQVSIDSVIAETKEKIDRLLASPKFKVANLPTGMPSAGAYLFSEKGVPLYVGRTNRLKARIQGHMRNNQNQATFAFLLARHTTGELRASYRREGSRSELLKRKDFRRAFGAARQRIREMDIQFIEEADPTKQALLEIFAAHHAGAEFNDFDNH